MNGWLGGMLTRGGVWCYFDIPLLDSLHPLFWGDGKMSKIVPKTVTVPSFGESS